MDNFQKIDFIVSGRLKQAKGKLEIARNLEGGPYGSNPLYVQDLQQEVDALSQIWSDIDAIKRNHPAVRGEMVQKIYGEFKD